MATEIQLPALSPTMTEGKILTWLKKEGDAVSSGDAIAEVETDKSNLEVEVYDDGVLLKILVPAGEVAKVGAPIAFIGKKGETVDVAALTAKKPAVEPAKPVVEPPKPAPTPTAVPVVAKAPPPPAAPGRPSSRRPGCTSSRGTDTRTIVRTGTTAPGSRGARNAGRAPRSRAPSRRG